MKKRIVIASVIAIAITGAFYGFTVTTGGESVHPEKYCAKMKDGKFVVMHEGNELTSTAILANGIKIQTDGTIIKKDGSKVMLKTGECINKEGKIMEEKPKEKAKEKAY